MENTVNLEDEELSLDAADDYLIYEEGYEENGKNETASNKDEQSKPDESSTENFLLELGGLPKFYPLSKLKKLLNDTLQLDANRLKPGGMGRNVAYANFKDEETRFKAKTILSGYKWLEATLTAKNADHTKDPTLLKKIDFLKVPKKEYESLPLLDRIQKAVIPYHGMTYEDQIKEKDKVVKSTLRKFGNELASLNPELKNFVHWQKMRRKGQICEVDDFVESPVKEGYLNKCEFTIGKNNYSDRPVVGFRVASYKEGSVEVGPVAHLTHLNEKMKEVVKVMECFLESSSYPPFDPFSHKGVWKQLTIRTSNNNDVMIIVGIHRQDLDNEEITCIKEHLKLFFTEGDGVEGGITSIFFQEVDQKESGKEAEYEHVYGTIYIEETILGKTFRASPNSFLQVNTPACEALYDKVAEVADIDPTSIVLDICCGVGTIGLSVAESSYKCMGVEIGETTIEDARMNAENNGITNAVFFNGKAEDHIENMIERSQRNTTIAVIDPPGAGLSGTVIRSLRKCEYLNKIVYLTSDFQAALPNFQSLGRPKSNTYKGSFFVPIRATPVDLFPDTPHFELIIVFERYDDCKWDRIMSGNPRPKDQEYFDRVPALSKDSEQYVKDCDDEERKTKQKEIKGSRGRNSGKGMIWPDELDLRDVIISQSGGGGRSGGGGYEDGRSGGGGYGGGRSVGEGYGRSFGEGYGRSVGEGYGGGNNWRSGGELESWQGITGNRIWEDDRANDVGGGWNRREGPGMSMGSGGVGGGAAGGGGGGVVSRDFKLQYGEGFQEGFQAALEALGGSSSGFGQDSGRKTAKTQGGYGGPRAEENFRMKPKGTQELCGWDYTGGNNMTPNILGGPNKVGRPTNSFQDLSTRPVAYPTSVTHPQGPGYGGGWNQSGNRSTSNYGWGGGQGGGTQFQNFGEPASKKWKGPQQQKPNSLSGANFGYSNY